MEINSLTFLYIGYFLSILLFISAGLISAFFVYPLQRKEATVKNGLEILRQQLLEKGRLAIIISLFCVLTLTLRYFITNTDILRVLIVVFVLVVAYSHFRKSWLDFKIYRSHYTPENIAFHNRVHQLEEKGKKLQSKKRRVKDFKE